jgi:hypothetical protein
VRNNFFVANTVMVMVALIRSIAAYAADVPGKDAAPGVELICLTEQPAIVEGGNATLRVWASAGDGRPTNVPITFDWQVDTGRIEQQGTGTTTQWDLSSVKVGPSGKVIAAATVTATQAGRGAASCTVDVVIGKKAATVSDRERGVGDSRISAKRYLLPGDHEDAGYGLYSYLLFSAPPKDAEEKARYLKTIEAGLLVLQDVEDYLIHNVRPRSLNVTYIPVKEKPSKGKSSAEWAANVLAAYDYAEAQILLSRVQQGHQNGPYLVSVLTPLSDSGTAAHLWEDLTGVVPEMAWDRMRFFTYLAAQERAWSEQSLERLGLKLRNLIAVGGKVTPMTAAALEEVIHYANDKEPRPKAK